MQPLSDHSIDLGIPSAGPAPRLPSTGPHPSMTLEVTPAGTVVVSGEIDSATASELLRSLRLALLAHPAGVTLDLAAVTFCDCAGLRAVLTARHPHIDGGRRALTLGPVSPRVARLLELTGTRELLGVPKPVGKGPVEPDRGDRAASVTTDRVGEKGPSQ
ncbi:STAS domain-containing protein [Streptomyces zaomyceticus]|uniref:STAS domain-containing protein n=1 Tax=Streptomyces zaomyceticus TaxID=68286 RepID=UPI00371FCBB4